MIDLFSIFSKGGLVLVWYINNGAQTVTTSVNSLLKSIVLQDKVGKSPYYFDKLSLQYHMDNEFDLIYVVVYQSVLELSYMDKFLTAIQLKFRDKYKNDLVERNFLGDFNSFSSEIEKVFTSVKSDFLIKPKRDMTTYQESYKSSKTLKSVTNENTKIENSKNKKKKVEISEIVVTNEIVEEVIEVDKGPEEELMRGRLAKLAKLNHKKGKNGLVKKKSSPTDSPKADLISVKAKGKENRTWDKAAKGADAAALDYSKKIDINGCGEENLTLQDQFTTEDLSGLTKMKGQMQGPIRDIEMNEDGDTSSKSEDEEEEEVQATVSNVASTKKQSSVFGLIKSWIGAPGATLTEEQMKPVLENIKHHLIEKNVATEVAIQLCDNVAKSLVGQKIGTFERVANKVKKSMEDSCRQLLNCGRRVDILRDIKATNKTGRPYVIAFCGVNGVGKSTNLAKISFWLVEQGFRVMIAACDTFRSGAVEQLRVHVQKLNYIHPPEQNHGHNMVHLYEKGYGKDAASVAFSAITTARDNHYDVVMIDTSGRMQDNEPLMRSLAKLITVNQPDLVLFVGEALVGHEAVDQLVKFNKALQDYSQSDHPRTIDGIVLTKFDTIDDKVGAAISMTFILGQPIMFVGTGQTYSDLRQLSPESVVKSLMK